MLKYAKTATTEPEVYQTCKKNMLKQLPQNQKFTKTCEKYAKTDTTEPEVYKTCKNMLKQLPQSQKCT